MELIEIGQIVNTHGIRGEVKLNPWTDFAEDLLEQEIFYLQNGNALHVKSSRMHKNCLIVAFSEISDMNAAEKLKNTILYTEKTPLPEGRYYIADLLGMKVFEGDTLVGTLQDVFSTGANDIYDVKTEKGTSLLIPVIDGVVLEIDTEQRKIMTELPAGLPGWKDED